MPAPRLTELALSHTEPHHRLDIDGRLHGTPPMAREQVLEALRLMMLSRAFDDICTKLQRMGRIGLYGPVHGQEASVVGSAMALDPERDWIVPASREQPAMLRHGWPLDSMFAAYMGRLDLARIPPRVKLLTRQQSIAAQLPQAAGLAWSMRIQNEAAAVMVYCGDGASSEGDFHEACNLAGVMHAPLVIVLINNAYAISTPVSKQTAGNLAARALGYGFPGIAVDGNDLFAVYDAATRAVNRALKGGGPTLIECRTYRVGFHNTSDNPNEYRSAEEVAEAVAADPIDRLRRYVLGAGLVSEPELAQMSNQIAAELEFARKRVEQTPRPGPDAIFEHVYADLPVRVQRQRDEARALAAETAAEAARGSSDAG
jgi:TPP-dependent pyruvate/acetoin dehydrogenase alpha subunit